MNRKRLSLLAALVIIALVSSWAYATLTSTVTLRFNTTYTGSYGLGTARDALDLDRNISFTDGTGANQAEVIWHDSRTLADDASDVLDLYASGSLLDPIGGALTISAVKLLYIKNTTAAGGASLVIGGGTTPLGIFSDTTDLLILEPGGIYMQSWPTTTGLDITTNKNLKVLHDGTGTSNATYEIIVLGED